MTHGTTTAGRLVLRAAAAATLLMAAPPFAAGQHHEAQEGRHGNPADLQSYIENLRNPERDAWQQPDRVVAALGLKPGQTACDVGSGPGYFTLRLAAAVGPMGRVYAVDVEPVILDALRGAVGESGARNVTPVLGLPDTPLLPAAACDAVLVVNTYHHFPDGPAYLEQLARALAPGGVLANIDYRIDSPSGPRHRISREDFLQQARSAGWELAREESFLERQYFLLLQPAP